MKERKLDYLEKTLNDKLHPQRQASPLTTSFKKCPIQSLKIQTPTKTQTCTLALVVGTCYKSRRAGHYTTHCPKKWNWKIARTTTRSADLRTIHFCFMFLLLFTFVHKDLNYVQKCLNKYLCCELYKSPDHILDPCKQKDIKAKTNGNL